jgi:excisionase family DNA binding protein
MPNAQSPQPEPASGATRSPQLFGDGTALEDVSFLTVAEVAGVMRVSKMTVYRMVHSGELTAVRVGRSFRVPAKAVREYLSGAYVGTD